MKQNGLHTTSTSTFIFMCLSLIHRTFLAQDFPNSVHLLVNLTLAFSSINSDHSIYLFSVNTVICRLYHVQSVTQYTIFIPHNHPSLTLYEGKSLNNRNFIITFLQEYLQKLFVSYFSTQSPCFATHLVHLSTTLRMPSRKKLDLLFHCLATLTGLPLWCSSLTFCRPFWNLSTHSYTLPWLKQLSPYWTFILV